MNKNNETNPTIPSPSRKVWGGDVEWRTLGEMPTLSSEEGGRRIEGYALRFGVPSRIMYDYFSGSYFEETIDRNAVTEDLLNRSDVKALMEHNRERLLARSNQRKGSLTLTIDEGGLRYSFEAPDTPEGKTALELVRRGDIAGSSFAFRALDEHIDKEWDKERKIWKHTIRSISGLYDVSLTADPAYTQTSVDVRSLTDPADEEPKPQEPTPIPERNYNEVILEQWTRINSTYQ